MSARDLAQEMVELGLKGSAYRISWEVRTRLGLVGASWRKPHRGDVPCAAQELRPAFSCRPEAVAQRMRPYVALDPLLDLAEDGLKGRILAFGAWMADFGDPPDWHMDPVSRRRSRADADWYTALSAAAQVGDVKLTWEIGRFPHAYHIARAAAFRPDRGTALAGGLLRQISLFVEQNPSGRGIHWGSGQEIVFRIMAWLFALDVLLRHSSDSQEATHLLGEAVVAAATHVEAHIEYARHAVYNNHLLSEALGLLLAGTLLPESTAAARWRRLGRQILEEEAERQFYADGAYIQQSHNYHRVALQDMLWACLIARAGESAPSRSWLDAMERSLDFLLAHQNPSDGRLPNYGSNDGALPSILSTCDFSDFRPTLQAVSLQTRGERVYRPGPWDEEAAWFLGPEALAAPLREPSRRSVSFAATGYHVLRGDEGASFAAFRCGSLRDRFSQIDMLHLDVCWKGLNVLVDGGSYLYNGPPEWHAHFMGTASHNTLTIDGRDQMVHFRRFKVLYWTRANLLEFEAQRGWKIAAGEHYGYRRHSGRCVHRRSVLMVGSDLWVVADTVMGTGRHRARLHWLCGEFPYSMSEGEGLLLATPEGPFGVHAYDERATALSVDVTSGQENPPRGWLSRYYGQKVAVPSLVVEREGLVPLSFVSVLGAGAPTLAQIGAEYAVEGPTGGARFCLENGLIRVVEAA